MRPPVLLVGNFLSSSGGQTVSISEEIARHLSAAGWRVLTTSAQRDRLTRLIDMVGTVLCRRNDYGAAIVVVFSGAAFIWAEAVCAALRLVKRPYLLTLHGGNLPAFSRRWPARVRRLLSSAQAVVTPSPYLYDKMTVYRGDIAIVPNGIDLHAYTFRPRVSPRPRLIWMRALHTVYNPGLAVRVVALLAEEFPSVHLTLIGGEREKGSLAALRKLAAELEVAERVDLAGAIPKGSVPEWMDRADIFLNTTDVDNTPVSVLEALACGLCVVSTNVGGIPYMLTHEHDALLVPRNDAEAMAAAIRRILAAPELAGQLSMNGRRAAEQLDWGMVLPEWERLIRRVI